jgi:hypothetical protein
MKGASSNVSTASSSLIKDKPSTLIEEPSRESGDWSQEPPSSKDTVVIAEEPPVEVASTHQVRDKEQKDNGDMDTLPIFDCHLHGMWGCYDRFLLGTINLLGQTD